MGRPRRKRRIRFIPGVTYFKPVGVPLAYLEEVRLTIDELEALRLIDFDGKDQTKAAEKMNVSQSTVQRILSSARKKVAQGLVLGQAIRVKGGEEYMAQYQDLPEGGPDYFAGIGGRGPAKGSGAGRGRKGGPLQAGPGGYCVCTNSDCQHKEPHKAGQPCYQKKCSQCDSPMIRKL